MSKVAAAVAAVIAAPTPFDTLITELDTLAKAFPPAKTDKEKVAGEEEDEEGKDGKAGKEGELKKSFSVKLEDGTTLEVEDGHVLVKSLSDRLDVSEEKILSTLTAAVSIIGKQGALVKSLSDKLTSQETTIGEQGTLIKSLQADLVKIGNAGAGRKAVLSVAERAAEPSTALVKSFGIPEGVTPEAFFAKAFDKQSAGKITGNDIALAETCLNSGMAIPDNIIQRVMG